MLELHNARRIADPRATWGITYGNPVHDAVRAIAASTRVDFALDVLIDAEHRVTRAFGGEVLAMHAVAMAFEDGVFDDGTPILINEISESPRLKFVAKKSIPSEFPDRIVP